MAATNKLFFLAFLSSSLLVVSCNNSVSSPAILSIAVILFIITVVMVVTCIGICVFLLLKTPLMVKEKTPTLAELDQKKKESICIQNPITDEMTKEPL